MIVGRIEVLSQLKNARFKKACSAGAVRREHRPAKPANRLASPAFALRLWSLALAASWFRTAVQVSSSISAGCWPG